MQNLGSIIQGWNIHGIRIIDNLHSVWTGKGLESVSEPKTAGRYPTEDDEGH
jgi:hypothetical protein